MKEWICRPISAPERSTTWIGKTIRFILAVSAEHRRNNNTWNYNFYYSNIMVDKLEQSLATVYKEYCQNGGQKNLPEKKTLVEKKLYRKSG